MTDIKSLFDLLILQLSKHSPLRLKIKIFKFAFVHLRYFLGGDRPSQTTSHKLSLKKLSKIKHLGWYFTDTFAPTYSTQKI